MAIVLEETLVKEEDIGGGYVVRTYTLDPPQPYLQRNFREMFGLQHTRHVIHQVKIKK